MAIKNEYPAEKAKIRRSEDNYLRAQEFFDTPMTVLALILGLILLAPLFFQLMDTTAVSYTHLTLPTIYSV